MGGLLLVLAAWPCDAVEWVFDGVGPREPAHVASRMEKCRPVPAPCGIVSLNRPGIVAAFDPMLMGSALVGFENTVQLGAYPFPCNRQLSRGFTAAFRFALNDVMHTPVERAPC